MNIDHTLHNIDKVLEEEDMATCNICKQLLNKAKEFEWQAASIVLQSLKKDNE